MYLHFPWKKNLLRLPPNVLLTVAGFASDDCVVACVKSIPVNDIKRGVYAHISIRWSGDTLQYEPEVLPRPVNGRYSTKNVVGYEVVLRDEPKVTKSWSIESPNFGDWQKGSHDVVFDRDVYQREDHPPRLLPLKIECLGEDIQKSAYIFKVAVDEVLNRTAADFEDRLFFNLNLLQENVGTHNVYESDATSEDYLRTLLVNWEILPPGERDSNIARILSGVKTNDPRARHRLIDRYDFLARLKPESFVKGSSGFHRYFGGKFGDDLVVFENLEYGNAVYVMFEQWPTLSKLSRTELLSNRSLRFVRVPHTNTWKRRVATEVIEWRWRNGKT